MGARERLFSYPEPYDLPGTQALFLQALRKSLSLLFGNPLVKPLPRENLFPTLRRQKGYLQTAGLSCRPEEREALSRLLLRAGAVRVTSLGEMSVSTCCDAHNGETPLSRYLRITNHF